MCEYCGCQALATIDELTREHDAVVDLIGAVRTANRHGDVRLMAELARRIAAVLEPHTKVEEHGLFPALAGDFPDQIAALEAEHRLVEAVLGEAVDAADGVPTDPAWPRRLLDVLDVLRRHILKEQDGVFPAALAGLSTGDWEAIEAVRESAGRLAPPAAAR